MQVQMKNSEVAGPVLRRLMNPMTTAADSTMRGLSSALWSDCPCFDHQEAGDMVARYWSAATHSTADWTLSQAGGTGGAVTMSSVQPGVALLDTNDTATDAGVTGFQLTGPVVYAATAAVSSARAIWWEARVRVTGMGTDVGQYVVGLCDTDTTLATAGTVGASEMFAFHALETATAVFAGEKEGVSASIASAHTIVQSSWVKLGGKITATSAGVPTGYAFVNGVANSATITSANITVAGLIPSLAVLVGDDGGQTTIIEIDWFALGGRLGSSDIIGVNA